MLFLPCPFKSSTDNAIKNVRQPTSAVFDISNALASHFPILALELEYEAQDREIPRCKICMKALSFVSMVVSNMFLAQYAFSI
jgi:hypothetical protein